MFKKILFPTDFSAYADKAVEYLVGMKALGVEEVIQTYILEAGEEYPITLARKKRTLAMLKDREHLFKDHGLDIKSRVELGTPYREILKMADTENVSMIVIGCHGKGLFDEVIIGSVSDRVTREAKVPVLLVKFKILQDSNGTRLEQRSAGMFKKILYPTDSSPCSMSVMQYVRELKKVGCDEVIIANVVDPSTMRVKNVPNAVREMEKKLSFEKNVFLEQGISAKVAVPVGRPVDELLRLAKEERVSLIVIGSTGKGYFKQMLLGSVSENMVRHAKCPVMVVHSEVCMIQQEHELPPEEEETT
ncbi:MAG: universal stress protein [Actinomycetota bacterium]